MTAASELICCEAALLTGVPPSLMLRHTREPEVVQARDLAVRMMREKGMTAAAIGQAFGRDAGWVRDSLRRTECSQSSSDGGIKENGTGEQVEAECR